jgi:hypothetical protein
MPVEATGSSYMYASLTGRSVFAMARARASKGLLDKALAVESPVAAAAAEPTQRTAAIIQSR